MSLLIQKFSQVKDDIAAICRSCGRQSSEVKLLAVSKTNPPESIKELYDAGVREFGENRIVELTAKAAQLPSDIRWHFIGPLQSNKVRKVVALAAVIHSVSSLDLIARLERIAGEEEKHPDFLLEVNVSGEASKGGIAPENLFEAAAVAAKCVNARWCGLMTMAPLGADCSELDAIFRELARLKNECEKRFDTVLPELSMGMSGDYPEAIRAGATIVRVGSRIFR